jgi:hypothetical protein
MVINNKYKISMNLRSVYMAYNMLATFAVTRLIGLKDDKIVESLNNYIIKNDRVQKFELNGKHAMLLTSKHENSISYNQSISYVVNENKPCTVVFIVDAVSRKYFTSETSWLWDIDFEPAAGVSRVLVSGQFAYDVAVRLQFAGVREDRLTVEPDLDKMMADLKGNAVGDIYVMTCFTDVGKFTSRLKEVQA